MGRVTLSPPPELMRLLMDDCGFPLNRGLPHDGLLLP